MMVRCTRAVILRLLSNGEAITHSAYSRAYYDCPGFEMNAFNFTLCRDNAVQTGPDIFYKHIQLGVILRNRIS